MFAILGFLKTIAALASFLAAGAVASLVGQVIGRWSPLAGLVCGAAVVGGMAFWVWTADDANLKAQNTALKAKQLELVLTNEALRNTLQELSDAALHNEKVMNNLQAKLDAVPDRPECVIDKDIVDELNKIQ